MKFIASFLSEWMKRKRSAASWLVFVGGFFIPTIILLAQIIEPIDLPTQNSSPDYWKHFFRLNWESMSMFLLPMGLVLSTSLIAQIEYKNNTWKQVMTTPQLPATIFFAKFAVILVMMVQFFILFNIGIYLAAIIPSFIFSDVPYPQAPYDFLLMLEITGKSFVACLPVLALQFLLSMHFRNFLASVGIGLVLIIASLFVISSTNGYLMPYAYNAYNFFMTSGSSEIKTAVDIYLMASLYFIVITALNFYLFLRKSERG